MADKRAEKAVMKKNFRREIKVEIMSDQESGMLGIETAIFLSIYMLFVIVLMDLIVMVRTQIVVQSAVSETAKELSAYSYLLSKAGYFDEVGELKAKSEASNLTKLKNNYSSLVTSISNGESVEVSDFQEMINILQEIQVKDVTDVAASTGIDYASNKLANVASKKLIKKYINNPDSKDTDYLQSLGVKGGIDGLDFSSSHFPQDVDDDLRITATYHVEIINIPLLNTSFDWTFVTNATTRIWGN